MSLRSIGIALVALVILTCPSLVSANPIRLEFDLPGRIDSTLSDGVYTIDVTRTYDLYATITNERTTVIDLHGYGSLQANVGSWDVLMDRQQIAATLADVVLEPGESFRFFWGTLLTRPSYISDGALNGGSSGTFYWELFVFLSVTDPLTQDMVWDGYFPRLLLTTPADPIPEPSSLLLAASGGLAALRQARNRRRRTPAMS